MVRSLSKVVDHSFWQLLCSLQFTSYSYAWNWHGVHSALTFSSWRVLIELTPSITPRGASAKGPRLQISMSFLGSHRYPTILQGLKLFSKFTTSGIRETKSPIAKPEKFARGLSPYRDYEDTYKKTPWGFIGRKKNICSGHSDHPPSLSPREAAC